MFKFAQLTSGADKGRWIVFQERGKTRQRWIVTVRDTKREAAQSAAHRNERERQRNQVY